MKKCTTIYIWAVKIRYSFKTVVIGALRFIVAVVLIYCYFQDITLVSALNKHIKKWYVFAI